MPERAEIYVPAVARFPDDLRIRHDLLEPARVAGYHTGLMLLLKNGDVDPETARRHIDNLDPYARMPKEERPALFGMHPNKPLTGPNRFNFLENGAKSQEDLEQSINFVAQLPSEFTPNSGRALSFHLNTLIHPDAWVSDEDYWARAFEDVLARVRESAAYAQRHNVALAVETVPIPEFGDMARTPEHLMDDGHTYWADLGNPWPLLFWRDEVKKLRNAGTNIVTDVCHSFIALRTVHEAGRLTDEGKGPEALHTYMIHASDVEAAPPMDAFAELVVQNTEPGDVWHINDARGIYRTKGLHGEYGQFEEGVALFEGDIPKADLQTLIEQGRDMPIKYVIEVGETDFDRNPETRKSLEVTLR